MKIVILSLLLFTCFIANAQILPTTQSAEPAKRSTAPVKKAASAPQKAVIKIMPDADCELFVDGTTKGDLTAGSIIRVALPKGTYIIKAVAKDKSEEITKEYTVKEAGIELLLKLNFKNAAPMVDTVVAAKPVPVVVQPTKSTIKILPDVDCSIYIDGQFKGAVTAGDILKLSLPKGNYVIKAVTKTKLDQLSQDYTVEEAGVESLVKISMQPVIDTRVKKEADNKAEQQRVAEAKAEALKEVQRLDAEKAAALKEQQRLAALLTVRMLADADCSIFIDGVKRGDVQAGTPASLPMSKGTYLLKATDPQKDELAFKFTIKKTGIGLDTTISIPLKAVVDVRLAKEAAIRAEQARLDAEKAAVKKMTDTLGIDMVYLSPTSFRMGSEEDDVDARPVHTVKLSAYYVSRYETTVAQYRKFIEATKYKTTADKLGWSYVWAGDKFNTKRNVTWEYDATGSKRPVTQENHPVIHISWDDAVSYCQWLSQKTGKNFRLPTEAEWEYAAHDTSKASAANYNGIINIDEVAWQKNNSGGQTQAVGLKKANGFGIYDMKGNVWEWCGDRYDPSYYKNSPTENPQGSASGTDRVVRGGSWGNQPKECLIETRNHWEPAEHDGSLGFRIVLVP
jgi:formylglycine-generating enzyme required for sulfatase activity/CBS domain-containing protein